MAEFQPLPKGVASFGATELGKWLYVYSGHTGRTHQYSKEHMLHGFYRVSIEKGGAWESLEMGSSAQGVALISDHQFVYRIGGMQARNEPGASADLYSLQEAAVFDPATKRWRPLPSLPQPRSSHRAAILDKKLYVLGGWCIQGGEDGDWFKNGLVLDLENEQNGWKELEQPRIGRALDVVAHEGKIWMIGGLTEDGDITDEIHTYDPTSKTWSAAAKVPGIKENGNGIAACVSGGRLFLSGMDGIVYRLSTDQSKWEKAGKMPSARIHHRMVGVDAKQVIVVGGASRAGHLGTTEIVSVE